MSIAHSVILCTEEYIQELEENIILGGVQETLSLVNLWLGILRRKL